MIDPSARYKEQVELRGGSPLSIGRGGGGVHCGCFIAPRRVLRKRSMPSCGHTANEKDRQ